MGKKITNKYLSNNAGYYDLNTQRKHRNSFEENTQEKKKSFKNITFQYIAVHCSIYLCLVLEGWFNVYSTGNVIRTLYILHGVLSDIYYEKVLRLTWNVKSVPFTWNMG